MSLLASSMRMRVAEAVREARRALGWSQRELARRARVSQSTICRIERGSIERLTFEAAARVLDALGMRVSVELRAPIIADRRRQRDAGHARCVSYVARRLERAGWLVRTEVEIGDGRFRGWIDVLAFRPADGTLLMIEIKTELPDVGAAMRQYAWYERDAWTAARRLGWRPRRLAGSLLVLASATNLERLADNRQLLRRTFPATSGQLASIVAGQAVEPDGAIRSIAMIDPFERSTRWLLRSPVQGHPTRPRYVDYAGLMARMRAARRAA